MEFHQSFGEMLQLAFNAIAAANIVSKLSNDFEEQIKQIPEGKYVVGHVSIRINKLFNNNSMVTEGNIFLKSYDDKEQAEYFAKNQDYIHPDDSWSSSSFLIGPDSYDNPFQGGKLTWFCHFFTQ